MNEIAVFEFQAHAVRTVTDEHGDPWFVVKDVCDVLGIVNVGNATARIPKKDRMTIRQTDSHSGQRGGAQSLTIISEAGLYRLVLRSDKPEAEPFIDWVTSEVLPAIRKTGTYAIQRGKGPLRWGAGELSTSALAREFRACKNIALAAGLTGNPATISADGMMRRSYGVSPLGIMQIELKSEDQTLLLNPTQLALAAGMKNARAVNLTLERIGLQERLPSGEWTPTDKGRNYAVIIDTGKRHSNGTMIQQVKWKEEVAAIVKAFNEEAERRAADAA